MVLLRDPVRPRFYLDLEIAIRQMQKGQSEAQIFLGKVGVGISKEHLREGSFEVYDWVFLILDEEDHYDGQTELLPSMECATIRFRGGHKEVIRIELEGKLLLRSICCRVEDVSQPEYYI